MLKRSGEKICLGALNRTLLHYFAIIPAVLIFIFSSTGCKWFAKCRKATTPADHVICENNTPHKSGLAYPYINCSACHGVHLEGTESAPSCFFCHEKLWTETDPSEGSSVPADHTINKNGFMHKDGLATPMANCITCHGSDLKGAGTAPSCFSCHGEIWSAVIPGDHTISKNGKMHKDGFAAPLTNCIACHGSDLLGAGTAPSCYQCHADIWNGGAGLPADHTISKDGYLHKSGYKKPLTNCAICHGADLKGTAFAPSCYTCHGAKWL